MGVRIMVDTHSDGDSMVRLLKDGTLAEVGCFRNNKMLSMEIMSVVAVHTGAFITPEDKIIFSQIDDEGEIVETKTVEVEAFITKYKGRVDNLAIKPNKPASLPTAADLMKREEENLRDIIDWSLKNNDKALFMKNTEKLNELREMMGEK